MPSNSQIKFLQNVLGEDGAEALMKAVRKSFALEAALLPRTLLSWVTLASAYDYNGPIPGMEQKSFIEFRKSEKEFRFDGAMTVGEYTIPFVEASIYRLAAHLAVALDVPQDVINDELRGLDLGKLGKSIDLLIKSRVAREALDKAFSLPGAAEAVSRKALMAAIPGRKSGDAPGQSLASAPTPAPKPPPPIASNITKPPSLPPTAISARVPKPTFSMPSGAEAASRQAIFNAIPKPVAGAQAAAVGLPATKIDKAELPGQQAKPIKQQAPLAPQAPQKQPKMRLPQLKVTKAEQANECPVCHRAQFKDGKFTGCLCLFGLSKSVKVESKANGDALLSFGPMWDMDAVEVLIEAIQGPQS